MPVMATFGWSYKSNASGSKRPQEQSRKVEEWQKNRPDATTKPLHPQSHTAETLNAGTPQRRKKCESFIVKCLDRILADEKSLKMWILLLGFRKGGRPVFGKGSIWRIMHLSKAWAHGG